MKNARPRLQIGPADHGAARSLGRRWTLRIMWELREGPLTSRALRTACDDASPTVVQARLSELREAGLVELLPGDGYRLTGWANDLRESFLPLHRFAERWSSARRPRFTPPPPSGSHRRPARP